MRRRRVGVQPQSYAAASPVLHEWSHSRRHYICRCRRHQGRGRPAKGSGKPAERLTAERARLFLSGFGACFEPTRVGGEAPSWFRGSSSSTWLVYWLSTDRTDRQTALLMLLGCGLASFSIIRALAGRRRRRSSRCSYR